MTAESVARVVVPTRATRALAQALIDEAERTTGADAALGALQVARGQELALIAVLLTTAKGRRAKGRPRRELTLTDEEQRRGRLAYRDGDRTPFAVLAYREYQCARKRDQRSRGKR